MRPSHLASLIGLLTLSAASFVACSRDDAPAASTSSGSGSGAGGAVGAGGAGGGAGGEGGGAPPPSYTHEPEGCGYAVTMDGARGFDMRAGDDTLGAAPAPLRVRLGLGGETKLGAPGYADPSKTVAVVWDTDVETTATTLRLGSSKDALDRSTKGFSWVLPGAVPVRVHRADLCGLAPATTYYYQVGGGPAGKETWSEVRSFTTAAAPDAAGRVVIGVSGDSRDSLDVVWPLVQTRLAKAGVDLQIFSGDSIRGYNLDRNEEDYARWFDGAAKAGSLGSTWIAAIGGNHENLAVQWLANHALPGSGPDQALYASFDVGPAHVVLIDDQIVATQQHLGFDPDTRKRVLDWLGSDLAAADARRATVPWIVVAHHRGPLSTSKHGDDSDLKAARDLLLPLYDAHHVDLVLSGHDHNYERSKPAKLGAGGPQAVASEAEGTVYVVCAGAGADGYGKGNDPAPYRATNWQYDGTSFVGVYGMLTIDAKTLSWKALGLSASAGGPEVDQVVDEVSWSK